MENGNEGGQKEIIGFLQDVLDHAGIPASIEYNDQSDIARHVLNIVTPDGRLLVGRDGENIFALEHLIRQLVEKKTGEHPRLFLDVNGNRMRSIEELKDEAKQSAKRVRLYRKELVLHPMSSFERRIVHMVLAEYPDITTESIGEGDRRRVVIKPYP